VSSFHSDDLAEAFWHPGTADLPLGTREPSEQFYTDATRHSDLDLTLASFFPTGGEFIMSMHQYMPDQAVLADSWTLFCPECSQKMRIIMAAPAQDGKETRTFECVSGHREWMTVALH
jgi:hypothetical protein